jgi:hypothetical protein
MLVTRMGGGLGLGARGRQPQPVWLGTLFAGGESGGWWDPSDLPTMWQTTTQTTRAEVDGPVGRIEDKSGNGNHLLQASTGARPTLREADGRYWLEFDGVDDFLAVTLASSITQPWERISGLRQLSWAANERIFSGTTSTGDLYQFSGTPGLALYDGGSAPVTPNNDLAVGDDGVVSEIHDGADSTLTIDNGTPTTPGAAIGTTTVAGVNVGRRGASANLWANFRWYGSLMIGRELLAEERALVRQIMAEAAGVTL